MNKLIFLAFLSAIFLGCKAAPVVAVKYATPRGYILATYDRELAIEVTLENNRDTP